MSVEVFQPPKVAFYRLTGLSLLFPKKQTMSKYNLTYLKENEISDVEPFQELS